MTKFRLLVKDIAMITPHLPLKRYLYGSDREEPQ